jgi:glycosyltransferase involved in cell wall biosynthesis
VRQLQITHYELPITHYHSPMRIGLIAGEYPPMQGGVGDFTRQLALACAAAGHEPHVIARYIAGQPAQSSEAGVTTHRIISQWNWETRRRIEGFMRLFKPDALNLQYQAAAYQMHPAINLLPGALAKNVPTVVTFHDLKVPYLFPKAGPLRWKSIVAMAKGATACIVTNVEDCNTLIGEGVRDVSMIPIGSNVTPAPLDGYDRDAWLAARGIPANERLIGYFGFMNESKGGETLLRALAELRRRGVNAGLLHVGGQTGDSDPTNRVYAARLESLSREWGLYEHVHLTGFLDERGVTEAFAACDAVALPYRDGASFRRGTLMAALAHGCAIVTTTPRVPVPELAHAQNVLLVQPDAPDALADAIQRVLNDSDLKSRLQAGALALSRQFQWDHIAEQTARVFERAIGNET